MTEFELESINREDEGKKEKVDRFFEVEEMFDFDNLGFTNTRDNFKVSILFCFCFLKELSGESLDIDGKLSL